MQIGQKILWGTGGDTPALPDGYTIVREPKSPARAFDKDGREFLIALDPLRLVPACKHSPSVKKWWDFKHAIFITSYLISTGFQPGVTSAEKPANPEGVASNT
jgi:hypothetical protein